MVLNLGQHEYPEGVGDMAGAIVLIKSQSKICEKQLSEQGVKYSGPHIWHSWDFMERFVFQNMNLKFPVAIL